MADPDSLICPQCGSAACQSLDNDNYQCADCGHTFFHGKAEGHLFAGELAGNEAPKLDKKQATNILLGVILVAAIFGYGLFSADDGDKDIAVRADETSVEEYSNAPKYTEVTQSFQAVPGPGGPELWLIMRRNSSDLKEVDYRISILDPVTKKEIYSRPVITTMTWAQSFEKDFQLSQIKLAGTRCWLIIGQKELIGFDIATRQKTMDNAAISTQYHQFADGISRVENLNNIDGFKVTSTEGFTYYYLPEDQKVLTEVEYDNVRRNENMNNTSWAFQTQYVFTEGENRQLYKLVRRQQNLRMRKILPAEVLQIVNDGSLWSRKMYNVVDIEEFTPGVTYYNSTVLFFDSEYCIYIATRESSAKSAIRLECLDKNRKLLWALPAKEAEAFRPYLGSEYATAFRKNNMVVFQIPYHRAIGAEIQSGKIVWEYELPGNDAY